MPSLILVSILGTWPRYRALTCFRQFLSPFRPPIMQAFFLTPAAEKTKTQGQNSSKKLKKKTQTLGGLSLPFAKLKKKN